MHVFRQKFCTVTEVIILNFWNVSMWSFLLVECFQFSFYNSFHMLTQYKITNEICGVWVNCNAICKFSLCHLQRKKHKECYTIINKKTLRNDLDGMKITFWTRMTCTFMPDFEKKEEDYSWFFVPFSFDVFSLLFYIFIVQLLREYILSINW